MYHPSGRSPPSGGNPLTRGTKYCSIWTVPNAVGVFNGEGPPVPIPNTEVKLTSAENTWLEAARENRATPTQTKIRSRKRADFFVCIIHYSFFIIHYSLNKRGFLSEKRIMKPLR